MPDPMTSRARQLRRNMTPEERKLWYCFLRGLEIPVRRQVVIGPYIADFLIYSKKIVIEADGSQHYEGAGEARDLERDRYLREQGYTILRYPNNDIRFRFSAVCADILRNLGIDPG